MNNFLDVIETAYKLKLEIISYVEKNKNTIPFKELMLAPKIIGSQKIAPIIENRVIYELGAKRNSKTTDNGDFFGMDRIMNSNIRLWKRKIQD